METLITRNISAGALELGIYPYLNGYNVMVHLDGEQFAYGELTKLRDPKQGEHGEVTYYVASLKNPVGVYAHEAEILMAAMAEASANNPEHEARRLRDQRERLVREINGIRSDARADIRGAWDYEGDIGAAYRAEAEAEKRASALEAELAEFDAQHPEVLAEIEAERAASAARNQWN